MTSKLRRKQEDHDAAPEVFQHDSAPEVVSPEKEVYRVDEHRMEYYGDRKGDEAQEIEEPKQPRLCGLKRRTFIWLAIAAAIVIIAVVLGATLSQVLKDDSGGDSSESSPSPASPTSSASPTPLVVKADTGIGAIESTSTQDQAYGYYQDENNNVIEAEINGDTWQFPAGTTLENNIVVSDAAPGTPLSALPYTFAGIEYVLLSSTRSTCLEIAN